MEGRPSQPPPPGGPQKPPEPGGPRQPSPPGAPRQPSGPGAQAPPPTAPGRQVIEAAPDQRIDGLRTWLAQVERKLALRTYIGGALGVLALAAGVAAIMLSLGTRENAATEADMQDLREELTGVEQTAAQAAQKDVRRIRQSLTDLQGELGKVSDEQGSLQDELSVVKDDIQDLRTEISNLRSGGAGTTGGAGTRGETGG